MRRTVLTTLSFAFALVFTTAHAGLVRVYITNSAGDTIDVIDPATNKVVQQIKGIEAPHGITFAPDGSKVYVSDENTSTLDVFDRESGALVKKIALSAHPNNIAVTPSGDRVVVAIARGTGGLDIVDTKTLMLKKTVAVHARLHNVYVTPDGKYAVMGSIPQKVIAVVDLATEEVAWELQMDLGVRPMTIEANDDGSTKRIFAQLSDFNGFAVIDFAARKEVARIKLPEAAGEFETDAERSTAPSHGIGVAPDRKTLWVTSIPNNAVYVYSLADLGLIGHVDLPALKLAGHKPLSAVANWITFTPDGKEAYVSNAALRSVTAIDMKAMKVIATIPVGEVPKRNGTMVMN
ncbi:MAG TPA: cytochrome D1 domain-containing protein [Xanthobacteraceae bacterium]|nr:cytochrome D1 domain-containing protein [Xanthobacteraceae bacterium]